MKGVPLPLLNVDQLAMANRTKGIHDMNQRESTESGFRECVSFSTVALSTFVSQTYIPCARQQFVTALVTRFAILSILYYMLESNKSPSLNSGCHIHMASTSFASPPQLYVPNEMRPLTIPPSVQDDDILWTEYLKVASVADARLVKDSIQVIDVLLVFVRCYPSFSTLCISLNIFPSRLHSSAVF